VHQNLVLDHRLAGQLARLLARPGGVRLALALAGGTEWTRRNFARWLFEDYPRGVVTTPRRWHRQVFHGPGAYAP
jgi:hypothetical protein